MKFVDFHTHLDWYENSLELEGQIAGFNGILVAASVDRSSFEKTLELKKRAEMLNKNCVIIPTIGIHPEKVLENIDKLSEYVQYFIQSPVIGEIGMDFCWYKEASPSQQEKVFRFFLKHCNETGKFCVIHTKGAEQEICEILKEYPNAKPVIHWYDGPEDIYKEFISRDYYFTFGCETKRSDSIKHLLKITPQNRILAETDNPTAEPWLGGNDNSLKLIERIYEDIGDVLGINKIVTNRLLNNNATEILKTAGIIQ